MRNIRTKFKIHAVTYSFFLLSFLCGYFKNALFIFGIVFLHEMGHVFMIKLCKYRIIKVEFYPFGGITKIDKPINSSIRDEMLISVSGIAVQILLFFFLFFNKDQLRDYSLLQLYNVSIMLFNLLPIIPLDGSVFVHSLLEKVFPYEKAFVFYQIVSWVVFGAFLFVNVYFQFNNYFICVVLIYQFILLKRQEKYLIHRFYLERYLNCYPYFKIENHKGGSVHDLRKEICHYFYDNGRYYSEKEMLAQYFYRN